MTIFVDESVNKNCWNMRDTFGEICIHCGCCSKNKERRYSSRIWVLNEWIGQRPTTEVADLQERVRS